MFDSYEERRQKLNMKRVARLALVLSMALLLLALPLFGACVPEEEEEEPGPVGPTKTTVLLGAFVGLTGPAAEDCTGYWEGYVDYVKWINEEEGGIEVNGVKYKIDFRYWDSGYTIPRALTLLKKAVDEEIPLLILNSQGEEEALKPMVAKEEIPVITGSIGEALASPPGWIYGITPGYPAGFGLGIDWIVENWAETRAPNIGFLTWDVAYGRAILTDECLAYAEEKGVNIVGTEFLPSMPLDLSPQLLKLKDAGADYIFGNYTEPQTSLLVRQAHELGVTPGAKLFGSVWAFNPGTVRLVGAEACEGYMGTMDIPWWTDDTPGVKLMKEMRHKYRPDAPEWTFQYPKGIVLIEAAREILRRTIEAVGIDNVTGANVKKHGIDAMKNYKDPNGFLPEVTFSADDIVGVKKLRIGIMEGGECIVSDWKPVPPLGWGR